MVRDRQQVGCSPGPLHNNGRCSSGPDPLLTLLQVLELVLPYVRDAATLLACSMASTDNKGHAQHAARQNLPVLLASCPNSDRRIREDMSRPMMWLCSFAGSKAVNTYEAGCALLTKVLEEEPQTAAGYMAKAGVSARERALIVSSSNSAGKKLCVWTASRRQQHLGPHAAASDALQRTRPLPA